MKEGWGVENWAKINSNERIKKQDERRWNHAEKEMQTKCRILTVTPPETLPSAIIWVVFCLCHLVFAFPVLSLNSYTLPKTAAQTQFPFASCLALLSLCWPSCLQLVLTFPSPGDHGGGREELISLFWQNCLHLRGRKLIFYCHTLNLFFRRDGHFR